MKSICAVRTWDHTPQSFFNTSMLFVSLPHLFDHYLTSFSFSPSLCSVSLSLVLQEQQYAQWMAACRLGSKGKTLADSSFQSEIQSIRSFLAMQKSSSSSHGNVPASDESINTHSLVSPRYHKKYKPKQVQERPQKIMNILNILSHILCSTKSHSSVIYWFHILCMTFRNGMNCFNIFQWLCFQQLKPLPTLCSQQQKSNYIWNFFTLCLLLQLTPRILDAYQNVAQLSLTDAVMRFLQIWQALPDFGLSYVVVR